MAPFVVCKDGGGNQGDDNGDDHELHYESRIAQEGRAPFNLEERFRISLRLHYQMLGNRRSAGGDKVGALP